jgi:hypothetical protein
MQDVSDTAIGCFWLHPVLTAFGEPTIPYMFTRIEWLVPCPTAALRVEKIKAMFARSVWLLMIMVLILTSLLFRSMRLIIIVGLILTRRYPYQIVSKVRGPFF